jgi:hypothetical protein
MDPNSDYGAVVPRLGQLRDVGLAAGHRPLILRELADLQMFILRIAPRPERLH